MNSTTQLLFRQMTIRVTPLLCLNDDGYHDVGVGGRWIERPT